MGKAALVTLALLAGILWSPQAPPRALALIALLPLLAAWRWTVLRPLALAATVAALGLLRLDAALAARVGVATEGRTVGLVGRVIAPPARDPRRVRFDVEVEQGELAGRRLQLVWYEAGSVRAG